MEFVERYHFHIDVFCKHDGKVYFVNQSRSLPKRVAKREFDLVVQEFRLQVGKFIIRPARDTDRESWCPGAVKIAENHRLIIVLSRCDCGGDSDEV